ncbi:DoxX family protein [bacterium]|nr:DoxX family protein [bacterium]
MNFPRRDVFLYWVITIPFLAMMAMSAYMSLSMNPQAIAGTQHLGYPLYFMKILGTFKTLGIIAIITNKSKLLKEWAYAGFAITTLSAMASHYASHDPKTNVIMALVFFGLTIASRVLWGRIADD